jgi:hypothetical protein
MNDLTRKIPWIFLSKFYSFLYSWRNQVQELEEAIVGFLDHLVGYQPQKITPLDSMRSTRL